MSSNIDAENAVVQDPSEVSQVTNSEVAAHEPMPGSEKCGEMRSDILTQSGGRPETAEMMLAQRNLRVSKLAAIGSLLSAVATIAVAITVPFQLKQTRTETELARLELGDSRPRLDVAYFTFDEKQIDRLLSGAGTSTRIAVNSLWHEVSAAGNAAGIVEHACPKFDAPVSASCGAGLVTLTMLQVEPIGSVGSSRFRIEGTRSVFDEFCESEHVSYDLNETNASTWLAVRVQVDGMDVFDAYDYEFEVLLDENDEEISRRSIRDESETAVVLPTESGVLLETC